MVAEPGLHQLDGQVERNRFGVAGEGRQRAMHESTALAMPTQQGAMPREQERHGAT
jgi:hypothetical protein